MSGEEQPKRMCACGQPAEANHYEFCYDCWWSKDPRNIEREEKQKSLAKGYEDIMSENKKDKEGPQPGPKPAPRSLNNRFIVESYKEDRALKATVTNGFAMVSQKVTLKGLKLLADVQSSTGQWIAYKGDTVYIRESSLQSQPWAKATFNSEGIDGEFMIVDVAHIEIVEPR